MARSGPHEGGRSQSAAPQRLASKGNPPAYVSRAMSRHIERVNTPRYPATDPTVIAAIHELQAVVISLESETKFLRDLVGTLLQQEEDKS